MNIAELVVRIGADMTGLTKGMDEAASGLEGLGGKLEGLGKTLSLGLTAPITAAGGAMLAAAVSAGSYADDLLDLVDQTGLTSATLQEFRQVAVAAGVDSDTLANAAIKLTTGLSGSGAESKQLTGAVEKLGVSVRDSHGALVPMDKLLPDIIEGLQGMKDVTQRNALAGDIFGKSWAELAPVLGLGSKGMADARKEAHTLGLVMSDDALASSDQFRRGLDTLKASAGAITRDMGVGLLPLLTRLADFLERDVIPAVRTAVSWFGNLSPTTQTVILAVAGLVAAIGPLLLTIAAVIAAIPTLTAALAVLGGATGIGLVIAGVAALTLVWSKWGDDIKRIVGEVYNGVKEGDGADHFSSRRCEGSHRGGGGLLHRGADLHRADGERPGVSGAHVPGGPPRRHRGHRSPEGGGGDRCLREDVRRGGGPLLRPRHGPGDWR
jgi:hypothetical protein